MKKILFICNVDWFFVSHRLPLAKEAIKRGCDVHVACMITDRQLELEALGIHVHHLQLSRSGISLFKELSTIVAMNKIVMKVCPDVVHMVTIKGVIYGGLVSRLQKIRKRVCSISGLGYVFIDNTFKTKFIRFFVKRLYRCAIGPSAAVIFQNSTDKSFFIKNKIIRPEQSLIIRGSGVCLETYSVLPEPEGKIIVMFLARLLKDKGIREFCESARILSDETEARYVLVGDIDSGNPNSLNENELKSYVDSGVIEHWGFRRDIENVIPTCHVMVLPSYREGLPKSLIEAAACGRPVITTDVPGCRDAIIPNKTGLLVPKGEVVPLAEAIKRLIFNKDLRNSLGSSGRQLAEEAFDIKEVVKTHMSLYEVSFK